MRQRGNRFLQEAEIQWDRWCFAVAGDKTERRGDSERGCEGTYICSRFRFLEGRDDRRTLPDPPILADT